jgi:glycosyltransferase involved in cell wall biosynthesis
MLRVLFIPNWKVSSLEVDTPSIQAPDKFVKNLPYWFFRYFPIDTHVDVIDIGKMNIIRKIEKKMKFYICQPLKAFLFRNKYNVVISHGAQSGLFYEFLTSFVKQKPLHVMIDVGGLNGARSNFLEVALIRFAMRKKPTVVIHSSRQITLYQSLYPFMVDKVYFIPFGVDCDYFGGFAQVENIGDYAVSFGSLKRDYPTLLKSWKNYSITTPLHIIGVNSGPYQSLSSDSVFFFDKMPLLKLIKQIKGSRFVILTLPVYNYSYGQMSLLQSMALKKVVIVTFTVSTSDYIKEANGVFGVEPDSPEQLAAAVRHVLSLSHRQLIELGESNQNYLRAHFNEKNMAEKIFELCKM